MRILFIAALVANLLFELMAAVLLITDPQGAFSKGRMVRDDRGLI